MANRINPDIQKLKDLQPVIEVLRVITLGMVSINPEKMTALAGTMRAMTARPTLTPEAATMLLDLADGIDGATGVKTDL